MERQRLRYAAGYCAAILVIAVVWFRTEALPEMQAVTAEGTTETRQKDEEKNTADDETAEKQQRSEAGSTLAQTVEPEYQALYPDMYVKAASQETGGKAAEEEVRTIYLTFDDGPSEITKEVVEALNEVGAKAAFFLIGNEITEEREELVREMAEDGHIIGIHTYSHNHKEIYSSVESYLDDFHKAYERIYEVTGKQPVYFRFPWGSINCYNKKIREDLIKEMERRGFQYFDWNVSAEDSVGKPTEYSVLHNVTDNFPRFRNAVVLMHDSSTNQISARMLPKILKSAKEKGYLFGTIDQLEKPYHWPNSY